MLNINRKLSHKGFSLIELMVAVAILALAIFGIFHAYSTGFMGMADARDRTVATNYAQEAMEDIKNMDFEKIITQGRSFINGTKFEREVIVQESTNLKKVTTKVYWKNRNGNTKIVETNMLVHFLQTTAEDATRIMLIADPYNILTSGTSTLTAVVKDNKGNTVTTWNGDISFSITSGSGGLSQSSMTPEKGIANTTFTASSSEGNVIITAEATGLTSDSVTIKVTDPEIPVKIILTASPIFMTATTSSTSEITATIVDAGGDPVTDATNEITFSVSGPGSLSNQQPLTLGVVEITLTSNGTAGAITVTASASELEPGVVDVITGGQISLSASNTTVPVNEKSVITVTTKDVNGVPINYIGTIDLSVEATQNSNGSGSLSTYTLDFDGSTSSNTITFTAFTEGTVKITATDQAGILGEGSMELTITEELVPHHIAVYANPSSIKAGGTESSTITARVKTEDGVTVTSYTDLIIFTTTKGAFPNGEKVINTNDAANVTYNDGVAIVVLYPPDTAGTAEIKVYSPSIETSSITGSTKVGFYIEADHIELVANPQNIAVGGKTCTITATIKDGKTTVTGYSGTVRFSIVSGQASGKFTVTGSAIVTVENGVARIDLQSKSSAGTVRIKATSSFIDQYGYLKDIEGYLNIPVGISLTLVEDSESPKYHSDETENSVSFKIDVQGAKLILEEMQVSWETSDSSETLNKIKIEGTQLYSNSTLSGTVIDVTDKTLSTGISTIILYFNIGANMIEKNMEVIFNPNSGNYPINF
ncbi:prepilin-type N-terminal cleavage/methylation domain-containing protein [bacterium]|nr:prepilin-type N-terminal cleavage/methylation domain-containing protein [bacterium]